MSTAAGTIAGDKTRAWLTTTTGQRGRGQAVVEYLTDEQALDRLTRGQHLRPVGGTARLVATIATEVA
jgi:hypothetical protein